MPPSSALLGGFAISAWVALLWQHNTIPSYKLASTLRYNGIVRTRNVSKCSVLALCVVVYFCWLMADWTVMDAERRLSKPEVEFESDINESENPPHFEFAKICRNLTRFGFEVCHIPTLYSSFHNLYSKKCSCKLQPATHHRSVKLVLRL